MGKVVYGFGPYVLSRTERQLWRIKGRAKRRAKLEPRQLDLLIFFVENAGELISKETLRQEVWGGANLHENTIPTAISKLGAELKKGDPNAEYIQGVPTKGYCFVRPVTRLGDTDKEETGVTESTEMEHTPPNTRKNQLEGLIFTLGLADLRIEIPEPTSTTPGDGFKKRIPALPEGERAEIVFDFALRASARMIGPTQSTWLDLIEDEYVYFGEALDYYGRTSASRELELAVSLSFYWEIRGHWTEGRDRLRHALIRQGEEVSEMKAKALTKFGYMSYVLDDYKTAKQSLSEGVCMSKEIGDYSTLALALHALAGVAEAEGKYAEARAILKQALAAARRAKADWIIGRIYDRLGLVARSEGDYVGAQKLFFTSLAKMEAAGDKRAIGFTYSTLSVIALGQQDLLQARLLLDKSQEVVYGTPGKQAVALFQFNLGLIEEGSGQYTAALDRFQKSLLLRLQIGEKRGVAKAMEATGKMKYLLGSEKDSAKILGAADALRQLISAPLSPNERKRYGWFMEQSQKKFLKEYEDGGKRVLEEIVVV